MSRRLPLIVSAIALSFAACNTVFGEDPDPILRSLEEEPALELSPPGATYLGQRDHAESGSVYIVRTYRFAGDDQELLAFYRNALTQQGWQDDGGEFQLGDAYRKSVAGRQASFFVIPGGGTLPADPSKFEVQTWIEYDIGLLGG